MECQQIHDSLSEYFDPFGLQNYMLKVGWYNDAVSKDYQLPYEYNTMAFVVISKPSMFEKAFIPFLKQNRKSKFFRDPIDECHKHHFEKAKQLFTNLEVHIIQDFELHPNRKPKALMQTAAHVAGAAHYYQKADVENMHNETCPMFTANEKGECICQTPWGPNEKIYGVCYNELYGGWFAIRGLMIFKDVQCPSMVKVEPPNCLQKREQIVDALIKMNNNWQDWTFRDIIPVKERYSENQKLYFSTPPKERPSILDRLVQ